MTSEFIEGSKHPEMTKAVDDYIFGGAKPNTGHLTGMPSPNKDVSNEFYNGETGLNYTPPGKAGSDVK